MIKLREKQTSKQTQKPTVDFVAMILEIIFALYIYICLACVCKTHSTSTRYGENSQCLDAAKMREEEQHSWMTCKWDLILGTGSPCYRRGLLYSGAPKRADSPTPQQQGEHTASHCHQILRGCSCPPSSLPNLPAVTLSKEVARRASGRSWFWQHFSS